jgi:hypothetical protein
MPSKATIEKAKQALREGKAPSTAAGAFIREEIERVRENKRDATSKKKAIAIGLAKARRAGVPLPPQPEDATTARTRRSLERAHALGQRKKRVTSARAKKHRKAG